MSGILLACVRLPFHALELLHQQRCLELSDAQISAISDVTESRARLAAAVVVKTLARAVEIGVVGENGATLAGVQVFRRLEAEAAECAQRADFATAPLRQMRLAGIFE